MAPYAEPEIRKKEMRKKERKEMRSRREGWGKMKGRVRRRCGGGYEEDRRRWGREDEGQAGNMEEGDEGGDGEEEGKESE